jgi:hypothetical protein
MLMHTPNLRKVRGSTMLAVPPAILDLLHLQPVATVSLAVEGDRLIVQPQTKAPVYVGGTSCSVRSPRRPPARKIVLGWIRPLWGGNSCEERGYSSGHEQQGVQSWWYLQRFNTLTHVPVVLPTISGGNLARQAGFTVSLQGPGSRTTGVAGHQGSVLARIAPLFS